MDAQHPVFSLSDFLARNSSLSQVLRSIIAPCTSTRDLFHLAITCSGMYHVLRQVLVRRKKAGKRALAHARKQSRHHPQPQPQPQNHGPGHEVRVGRYRVEHITRRSTARMFKVRIATYFGVRAATLDVDIDFELVEVNRRHGVFLTYRSVTIHTIADGLVVRTCKYGHGTEVFRILEGV